MELFKYFYFLLYFACVTFAGENESEWAKQNRQHKAKTLGIEGLQRLAMLTDNSDDYFKNTLLLPILRERVPDTDGNRYVQQHIKNHMTSYGWRVEEDRFLADTPEGRKTFTNIIATQDTSAPRKLVLACHHDSKYFQNLTFVGATDSAVPCAMMLDLARLMNETLWKKDDYKAHDISLQFIFFDGKEAFHDWTSTDSSYGARHLAAKLHGNDMEVEPSISVPELDTVDLMILLSQIGTTDTQFRNWFPATEKRFIRMKKIELILMKHNLLALKEYQSVDKQNNYFVGTLQSTLGVEDDHLPFLDNGVPVLHLISYPFPAVWHKETDNEFALDYDAISNIGKILRVFVAEYLHLSP